MKTPDEWREQAAILRGLARSATSKLIQEELFSLALDCEECADECPPADVDSQSLTALAGLLRSRH